MSDNTTCPSCQSRASSPHCSTGKCNWRDCVCGRTYDPRTGRHMLSPRGDRR